ncbi:MAG: methylmalonyl Co-A mutase-associated GTPase MeaB [Bdellovibrionota bacterium]
MVASKLLPMLDGIAHANRRWIAKAITLVESSKVTDSALSDELLTEILPHTGSALRIGISGIPGVGKSTFIEEFGRLLLKNGKKIGVLAVDPSSPVSGGSIMGDKTRMEKLAADENVFIRPSPAGDNLGGVARKTRESSLILDAAGYDIILIETVGVGQSEVVVASLVDVFLVLQMPSTGDELQSIKKGILEVADIIAINKADGDLKPYAMGAVSNHKKALNLIKTHKSWIPPVLACSAIERTGLGEIWQGVCDFVDYMKRENLFDERRHQQTVSWFDNEIGSLFLDLIKHDRKKRDLLNLYRKKVLNYEVPPTVGARQVLNLLLSAD